MNSDPSVSSWIRELQSGDQFAAQRLWERYFEQLVHLARRKLPDRLRRHTDEEDVALSAFNSFCRGMQSGRYPQITDRNDLWRMLVTITAHKAIHVARRAQRQKRGGRATQPVPEGENYPFDFNEVIGREPSPEFSLQVAEELDRLLTRLED